MIYEKHIVGVEKLNHKVGYIRIVTIADVARIMEVISPAMTPFMELAIKSLGTVQKKQEALNDGVSC